MLFGRTKIRRCDCYMSGDVDGRWKKGDWQKSRWLIEEGNSWVKWWAKWWRFLKLMTAWSNMDTRKFRQDRSQG